MNYPWGGVVVYHGCLMLLYITKLVKWDVPVWIYWGSINGPYYGYDQTLCKFLLPSQEEIMKGIHMLKTLQPHPNSSRPSIFEGSRQKIDEQGLIYLSRRASEISEFMIKADEREIVGMSRHRGKGM